MLKLIERVVGNRVLIQVQAAVEQNDPNPDRFVALVDTGATATFVTRRLAAQIGAVPIGRSSFASATEPSTPTNVYGLSVAIPVDNLDAEATNSVEAASVGASTLTVLELPYEPPDYDVILGMDMLTRHCIFMTGDLFVLTIAPPPPVTLAR